MDGLEALLAKLATPLFMPLLPSQRIYLLYLASALLIAFAVYLAARAAGTARPRGFFSYCLPRAVYGHPSALVDYAYFFINKISFTILFAPLVVTGALVAGWTAAGLESLGGAPGPQLAAGWPADLLLTLLTILAMDLAIFLAHLLQHRVPALWEFHKVHHSAEVLTPMTAYRMHPVDDLLSGTLVGLLTGCVQGVFAYLCGETVGAVEVLRVNALLFTFYVAGYNLRHSHVWLAYPGMLGRLLVSPALHQIHHSSAPRHFDRNLGFIFAFWDRLAGTLYLPERREEIDFGLYAGEHRDYDTIWKLYFLPFKKAAARFRGPTSSGA